jgi:hypothetical protein
MPTLCSAAKCKTYIAYIDTAAGGLQGFPATFFMVAAVAA